MNMTIKWKAAFESKGLRVNLGKTKTKKQAAVIGGV